MALLEASASLGALLAAVAALALVARSRPSALLRSHDSVLDELKRLQRFVTDVQTEVATRQDQIEARLVSTLKMAEGIRDKVEEDLERAESKRARATAAKANAERAAKAREEADQGQPQLDETNPAQLAAVALSQGIPGF